MKITEIQESTKPITKAKQIWSQIDSLFVDLLDEMLAAQRADPENSHIKKAINSLEKDQLTLFHQELRKI